MNMAVEEAPRTEGGEKSGAATMTIDEMMKAFPKGNVEKAMFTRHYNKYRMSAISDYEECIRKGISVKPCEDALKDFYKEYPSAPPVDPTEPTHLDDDVLWKMRLLKYQLRPAANEDNRVNIDAVLDAYRRGLLKVDDETTTIWYAGKLVMGPVRNDDPILHTLGKFIPEWEKKYGKGDMWGENMIIVRGRKAMQASLARNNIDQQHTVS